MHPDFKTLRFGEFLKQNSRFKYPNLTISSRLLFLQFFSISGFMNDGLCYDSCFDFLEGDCGEGKLENALNQYLGTSPELQCIVSTLTNITDWKLLAINQTTLGEILQIFSDVGINIISNQTSVRFLIDSLDLL